ncbi:MAG: AMP-binding protein [Hyphomicrobiales bacterium]|nr:AMP-binding protein [Hyphomicrobiales bacterium]MBV8824241.1 AMP-binding protein [Hyphomicrobiales bacterium]MBV9428603.1 AMP-binding protein [Bradyrhizobiaceae bacterium]
MPFAIRLTPEMIARHTAGGWWANDTIYGLLSARVAAHPEREAIVDARRRVTYRELKDGIERTAAVLKAHGIGRGDVVTIQLPNWVEFAFVFFALELIGAVANKISPDFRSREVSYILRFSQSRAYVCSRNFKGFDYPGMVRALMPELPDLRFICVVDGAGENDTVSLANELDVTAPLPEAERVAMSADEVFRMAFTSGTTGNPKCVLHSFNTTLPACRVLTRDMQASANDVFLIYLPVGLNWGYLLLVQALLLGARVVLLDRFSGRAALELIAREKVTFVASAPASLIAMLNEPELGRFDCSSLRVVITGGASCPVETLRAFQRRMSGHLIELYGMLETGYHAYTRLTDDPERVNGTIGRCVEGMGLRLIDAQGRDVPRGAEGEIAADGPSVHLGYYNNPQANAEAFTADGWFRTGDLGVVADDAGNVRIVGRSKEIINRGGKKFFPREVEEILYTHPKVLHAAMVGIADPRLGERNCLCVVPKIGAAVSLAEFTDFLRDQVATYKLPERLEVLDELPFTPTGKIQRFILQRQIQARDRTAG